jgi:two-component system chemotaxis response regulator CheY
VLRRIRYLSVDNGMDALNVMIVDDSEISAKRLAGFLGRLGHRVVKTAANGAEALAAYPDFMPDLVAMDITMPGMDGVEATKRILATYPDAAVVIITSHGMETLVLDGIRAGAKGYLRKPVEQDDLERLIERIAATIAFAKPHTQLCALMFADVAGSSRIVNDALKSQLHMVLHGRIATIRARCQVIFAQHTGDGFFICGADVSEMADAALGVRDHFLTLDWKAMGFDQPVSIRVGLDLDKVAITEKAGNVVDVAGSGIDRAARIEPIATPGEVWCSSHFYHQLERENHGDMIGKRLGVKKLAKEFGRVELFSLGWGRGH